MGMARLRSVVLLTLVVLERVESSRCRRLVTGDFPTYIVNLEKNTERRKYMQETFGTESLSGHKHAPKFIKALNGTAGGILADHIVQTSDRERLHVDGDRYTLMKTGATRGQLGNTVSLLMAMQQALADGAREALILEDDVADTTQCLWPAPLSSYVRYADRHYPNWHSLRLEWGWHRSMLNTIKRRWYRSVSHALSGSCALSRDLADTWGQWTGHEGFPMVMPSTDGWGTVAVLWSRRGMQHMVSALKQDSMWSCPNHLNCISDNFFWHMAPNNATLVATPPLIGCRMSESPTPEIRKTQNRNVLTHMGITAVNAHWLIETYEMLFPRRPDLWPPKFQYSVGDKPWS